MIEFKKFKEDLKHATKTAYKRLKNVEDLYAFALYSDEYCQTISVVANTESNLKIVREDFGDMNDLDSKYNPEEWDFSILDDVPEFDKLTKLLAKEDSEIEKDVKEFELFQNKFYSTCFNMLLELREEGFFSATIDKDIFLIFTASEYEFDKEKLKSIVKKLNSKKYSIEYIDWMNTWA